MTDLLIDLVIAVIVGAAVAGLALALQGAMP